MPKIVTDSLRAGAMAGYGTARAQVSGPFKSQNTQAKFSLPGGFVALFQS